LIAIAWDVDDVLNDLMRSWLGYYQLRNANSKVKYEDITENPPHKILKITQEEYLRSLLEFRLSEDFQNMSPNPEVLNWFQKHGNNYRHIAVTATPLGASSASTAWVVRHFGNWIRTFHFTPSQYSEEANYKRLGGKADFLKWVDKFSILVDDSKQNVEETTRMGLTGLLFPRPWNKQEISLNVLLDKLTKQGAIL